MDDLETTVLGLLREGRKIEAVKIYRERTGAGLKEAKDAVEALERGERVDLTERPAGDWMAEVRALLAAEQKIMAIKVYRDHTGAGLKEAKDAVEALERGADRIPQDLGADEKAICDLLAQGRKLDAVKQYRDRTGSSLKDAVDAVEEIGRRHGLETKGRGCFGAVLAIAGLAGLVGWSIAWVS